MPLELPARIEEFLQKPNLAVMCCIRPSGYPLSVVTGYEWRAGRILVSMDGQSRRLSSMRRNSKVSVTIVDRGWQRHVSFYGEIISISEDVDLKEADSLAIRYSGKPFASNGADAVSRARKRITVSVEPLGWHVWDSTGQITNRHLSSRQES